MRSFKISENIQRKEGKPDRPVSDNQSSSVTSNERVMKARKEYCNFEFQQGSYTLTDINQPFLHPIPLVKVCILTNDEILENWKLSSEI